MVNTVSRMRQWYSHPPLTPILSLSAKCQIQLSSNHTCMEKTRYIIIIIIIIIIVNDIWNKSYMNCGNNPVEVLNFFQASSRNCVNCVHCDNFSLLLLLRVRAFLETFFFIKLSFFYSCSENTMPKRISELYTNFIWLLDLRNKRLLYSYCLKNKIMFSWLHKQASSQVCQLKIVIYVIYLLMTAYKAMVNYCKTYNRSIHFWENLLYFDSL